MKAEDSAAAFVDESPQGEAPAPVLSPEDRKREELRSIATSGSTFITTEPTQQLRFFEYLRMVDKKDIISGWDNVIDENERRTMLSHLKRAVSMVAPLAAKGDQPAYEKIRDDLTHFFLYILPSYDPQVQVNVLEMELSYWIDRSNFGTPPRAKVGEWDGDPEDVFAEARARFALAKESRELLTR